MYSRKSVVILDDVFSGMDASTEHVVFDRLLGDKGLLRVSKTTVIIATHAGQSFPSVPRGFDAHLELNTVNLLPSADYVVALGNDGTVIEQGTFDTLNQTDGYVRSFSVQKGAIQSQNTEPEGKLILNPLSTSGLDSEMDDKKRHVGDLKVYRYYAHALGKWASFLFVFFASAFGFFVSFPSKLGFYKSSYLRFEQY